MIKSIRTLLRLLTGLAILMSFAVVPTVASPPSPAAPSVAPLEVYSGEILVRLRPGTSLQALEPLLKANGLTVKERIPSLNVYVLSVPRGREALAIALLQESTLVEYAEPNAAYHVPTAPAAMQAYLSANGPSLPRGRHVLDSSASRVPNDLYYLPYQWNLDNVGQTGGQLDADINAPEAWEITTGNQGLTIAILDTGVDLDHPDLRDKIWINPREVSDNNLDDDNNGYPDDVHGFNFAEIGHPPPMDRNGRGTFFAGIAAAATDNGEGIAGIAWGARIMPVKILNDDGDGWYDWIVRGIVYAADNGADIISISIGFPSPADPGVFQVLQDAIRYAGERGALVVTQAGDTDPQNNIPTYPAALSLFSPNLIAVAATDDTDTRLPTSQRGSWINVAAPGASQPGSERPSIFSTLWLDGSTYGWAGAIPTAIATPHVAGVAALIWSVNPTLTPDEVRDIIEKTAVDLGPPGWDDEYGHGRVDAYAAVRATRHDLRVDPPLIIFLADDSTAPSSQRVVNRYTSALTWRVAGDVEWLTVSPPVDSTPSYSTVWADKEPLPGHGTYTATLTVSSTLNADGGSLTIPITFTFSSKIWRTCLPLVAKRLRIR